MFFFFFKLTFTQEFTRCTRFQISRVFVAPSHFNALAHSQLDHLTDRSASISIANPSIHPKNVIFSFSFSNKNAGLFFEVEELHK